MSNFGMTCADMGGAGHCLFYCLAEALFHERNDYHIIRRMVVTYIRKHQEFYIPFFTSTREFDDYCARMLIDEWGDYLIINAASKCLKTVIIIVESLKDLDILYVGEQVAFIT